MVASAVVQSRVDDSARPSRDARSLPILRPAPQPRLEVVDAPPLHEPNRAARWHRLAALAQQLARIVTALRDADAHALGKRSGAALFAQAQVDGLMREVMRELDKEADAITIELLDGALRRRMIADSQKKTK